MFVQIFEDTVYGPEVDWWSVGCVIYDMVMGKRNRRKVLVRPKQYPSYLTQDAISILRKVNINCGTRDTLQSL